LGFGSVRQRVCQNIFAMVVVGSVNGVFFIASKRNTNFHPPFSNLTTIHETMDHQQTNFELLNSVDMGVESVD
jgi:hypothetical protein